MYAVLTSEPLATEDLIPLPSAELLRRYGTSETALQCIAARPHQMVLMHSSTVEDAAFTQRDTRIEALQLAEQHDGLVIDLNIPRALELRSDEVSLAHATQWYVVDYIDLGQSLLRTVGLSAFALPEIVMTDVDQAQHAMFSAVLAGLVHRLIAEWPANDPVGVATVTLRDIAFGLGDPAAAETPKDRSIDVDINYADEALVVRLRSDPASAIFS